MKKSTLKRMALACLSASLLFSASAQAANVSYDTKYNGHCYKLFNNGMTWEQAKAACERQGGHLVSITSTQEQAVVENLLRSKGNKNNYWLGAYRNGSAWAWVTGERFSYTHWSGGQPDNFRGRENRLSMYRNRNPRGYNKLGEWNDSAPDGVCNNEPFFGAANFGYICEWDSDPNTDSNNSVDGRLKGDVNGDGKVDKSDADMLNQYIVGLRSSIPCPKNADMNGDGRHTLTDVSKIEMLCKSSSNVNSADGRMKGDVNGDGKVDKSDADMLSEYIQGNRSSLPCPKNADANGDGRITVADVTKIVSMNPTPVKHDPQGRLESCQPLQNAVRVTGYAYDEDNMSHKVRIHVYIDGTAGNSRVPSKEIYANKAAHNGHGFDGTIQVPAQWCGRRTVRLYALNDVGSGTFQEIGSQVVDIPGTTPPAYREWQSVAAKRATVYMDSSLTRRNGTEYVDAGDRVTVLKEEGNAYFVRYPVRNGTKERWVAKDIFTSAPMSQGLLYPLKGRAIENSSTLITNGQRCDYRAPSGTPIYAPADGTVQFRQSYAIAERKLASYGNNIVFTSRDGQYYVLCAHLSKFNGVELKYTISCPFPCGSGTGKGKYRCNTIILATKNVTKGELIGWSGETGNAKGAHVHIEVKQNGRAVNPKNVFTVWN